MKNWLRSAAWIVAFSVLSAGPATAGWLASGPGASGASISRPADADVAGSDLAGSSLAGETVVGWIVDRADNICGLDDPKMLSKPAKVDYDALLRATSEMKKIKDDRIDPNSPQGIQLRQAAATRTQKAAEKVRTSDGYCSVWKTIRHQDGRAVADITDAVKAQL